MSEKTRILFINLKFGHVVLTMNHPLQELFSMFDSDCVMSRSNVDFYLNVHQLIQSAKIAEDGFTEVNETSKQAYDLAQEIDKHLMGGWRSYDRIEFHTIIA